MISGLNNFNLTFDIKKTHFLVISKSGTTVETFSLYKYIYSLQNDPSAYTFITDPGSPLDKYAKEINASVLPLPDNVGGRFSVLFWRSRRPGWRDFSVCAEYRAEGRHIEQYMPHDG